MLLPCFQRDEIGIMACDEISKYGVGKSGMKGSESPSYFLEHESGKYYTLIEGEGHPASSEYERGRSTGVRRREKTPTHGRPAGFDLQSVVICFNIVQNRDVFLKYTFPGHLIAI